MLDTLERGKINIKDLSLPAPEKSVDFRFNFDAMMSEKDWRSLDDFFKDYIIESRTDQPPGKRVEFAGQLRAVTDRYSSVDLSQLLASPRINRNPDDYSGTHALNTYPEQALALVALEGRNANLIDEYAWRGLKELVGHSLEDTHSPFYGSHLTHTANILMVGRLLYPNFDQERDWVEKRRKDLLNWLNTSKNLHADDIAVMGASLKFTSPKGAEVPDIVNSKSDLLINYFNEEKSNAINTTRYHWLSVASYSFYLRVLNASEIQVDEKGVSFIDQPRFSGSFANSPIALPKVRSF